MNILINCTICKIGGGVQVAHSFLNEISNSNDHKFVVVLSSILDKQIDRNQFNKNFIFYTYDMYAGPLNTLFSSNKFLDELVEKHKVDRVFTVFGPSYWRPKAKHICGYAKPHYIYKNSPFFNVISTKEKIKLKFKEFFHLIDFKKNTDVIITENPDVTSKIKAILKKESYTVTNTYNQVFDHPELWKNYNLPKFEGSYLLTISANYIHKNLQIIPEVISELLLRNIKKFKFVISLNKGDLKNTTPEIDQYITYLGYVKINECPSLYQQANYLFLPTLLECFSASYAEAMKMEKVILTSDLDFARGICQDAAVYFNPLDPKDIANKILAIDSNEDEQRILIQKGKSKLTKFDNYKVRAIKYLDIILQ